ncbi:unnamed protein product [Ceutorhynchus assimilis]|uniref:Microtubule-associated proteins 1A/1B light chain 3C n=1 Tax=Ceutorhynchus assimilis TaxID=467358 RepID=A0A9N9MVU0_9CUCU|nr:unnamed protein product [Ceutorhynchus assimilis]
MYSKSFPKYSECCLCANNNIGDSSKNMSRSGSDSEKSDEEYPTKEIRKEEVMAIRTRFPNKIPVIVQKYWKENQLPQLDKSKFLVPQDITMSQFQTIIRNRMRMGQNQALYLLVNERSMLSLSLTLGEVYTEHAGPNGFLYITYASQEVFGDDSSVVLETNKKIYDKFSDSKVLL